MRLWVNRRGVLGSDVDPDPVGPDSFGSVDPDPEV